jgi:hypothetical protein
VSEQAREAMPDVESEEANGRVAAAAFMLAAELAACEALVRGLPVPRDRLNPDALKALGEPLHGPDIVLTEDLVLGIELRYSGARNGTEPAIASEPSTWLERASDLLAEPDPGPTPFLVEDLIVEGAMAAVYGPAKAGKTWLVLELARAIVTGTPALETFAVPEAGPVIVVLEESGRAALYRRLDALRRGNAQNVEAFAGLHFAANRRVRLNDARWQEALLMAAAEIKPRAIFFDPLARLKGADVDENVQRELGPVLDFMRDLRDASGAAVPFVHHTGHEGKRMRGSSDLAAYWESAVTVGKSETGRTLQAEHREAEASETYTWLADWDPASKSVRLKTTAGDWRQRVAAYLADNPDASANKVFEEVGGKRQLVLDLVREIRSENDA